MPRPPSRLSAFLGPRFARSIRALCFRWFPRSALRWFRATRDELGLAGEELAARSLLEGGWRLRGRRLRTRHGEVDLWASDAHTSLVVEVKTGRLRRLPDPAARDGERWDLRWRPGESLGLAQQRRLFRAARDLARRLQLHPAVVLIEVFVSRSGRLVEVRRPRSVLEPGRPPYTPRPP